MNELKIIHVSSDELKSAIAEVISKEIPRLIFQHLSKDNKKEYLTRSETAEHLGISLSGIHDWMKRGILEPRKIGNRTFFKYSEILEILEKSANK